MGQWTSALWSPRNPRADQQLAEAEASFQAASKELEAAVAKLSAICRRINDLTEQRDSMEMEWSNLSMECHDAYLHPELLDEAATPQRMQIERQWESISRFPAVIAAIDRRICDAESQAFALRLRCMELEQHEGRSEEYLEQLSLKCHAWRRHQVAQPDADAAASPAVMYVDVPMREMCIAETNDDEEDAAADDTAAASAADTAAATVDAAPPR